MENTKLLIWNKTLKKKWGREIVVLPFNILCPFHCILLLPVMTCALALSFSLWKTITERLHFLQLHYNLFLKSILPLARSLILSILFCSWWRSCWSTRMAGSRIQMALNSCATHSQSGSYKSMCWERVRLLLVCKLPTYAYLEDLFLPDKSRAIWHST